jgi:hypothetical protein
MGFIDDLEGSEYLNPLKPFLLGLSKRHPLKPTVAEIEPPVIAVATDARTNRKAVPVTTTGVNTVEAVVVLTAEPAFDHETPSRLVCIWTDPAETPEDETTTMTAVVRITSPSRAAPPPRAETADRETIGASP